MKTTALLLMSLFLFAAAPLTNAAVVPPGVNMLPIFDPGQIHRFDYSIHSTMKMSAFGSDQSTKSQMDARLELKVLEELPSEGEHALGLTYKQIKVSFDGGQIPGSFDSKNPASSDAGNVYAEICRPIIDKEIRLTVDRAGTITSIEGLEELAPEGLAGILFNQFFSEDAAKAMFQPLVRIVDNPAQERHRYPDSWELTRPAIASLGVAETKIKLQMKSGDNPSNIAVIDVSGEPKATMPAEAAVLPNIETKKSELTGQLKWNGKHGVLESLETEVVSQMESAAQGITITVDMTSTTRIKRLK